MVPVEALKSKRLLFRMLGIYHGASLEESKDLNSETVRAVHHATIWYCKKLYRTNLFYRNMAAVLLIPGGEPWIVEAF